MKGDKLQFISVIVPVYNGIDTLPQLFTSLSVLDFERRQFEIIFVDNGSTDGSLILLKRFVRDFEGNSSVYLEDCKIGSYAARNRALMEARGDIVAFTDADCQVGRHWLGEIQHELVGRGRRAVIGGRVNLTTESKRAPNAVEMYEMLLGFSQKSNVEEYGFSVTANLATWKDVFTRVGPFAELKSKGDFEWCHRASRYGYKVEYAENVVISHPARNNIRDLVIKTRRVTGGQFDLRNISNSAQRLPNKRSLKDQLSNVMRNQAFPKWHQKMCVLIVGCLVAFAKIFEVIRLKMGGYSERS